MKTFKMILILLNDWLNDNEMSIEKGKREEKKNKMKWTFHGVIPMTESLLLSSFDIAAKIPKNRQNSHVSPIYSVCYFYC